MLNLYRNGWIRVFMHVILSYMIYDIYMIYLLFTRVSGFVEILQSERAYNVKSSRTQVFEKLPFSWTHFVKSNPWCVLGFYLALIHQMKCKGANTWVLQLQLAVNDLLTKESELVGHRISSSVTAALLHRWLSEQETRFDLAQEFVSKASHILHMACCCLHILKQSKVWKAWKIYM